jgi:hypothetical protein
MLTEPKPLMSKQRKRSALSTPHSTTRLWRRWVAAMTLAGVTIGAITYSGAEFIIGASFLPGTLLGTCILAACETWALRPILDRDRWLFFAATALGAGWGALIVILLWVASMMGWAGPLGLLRVQYALPLSGALLFALLSIAQWLVLRRQFAYTGLWIPVHMAAGLTTVVAAWRIGDWLTQDVLNHLNLAITLATAALASALAGAISGLGVVRLTTKQPEYQQEPAP